MKNLSILLVGFFFAVLMVGCHYDEIPIECTDASNPSCCDEPNNTNCCPDPSGCDPCDNLSNPSCCAEPNNPNCCDNPASPDCITTFDTTLTGFCNSFFVYEVIELPNEGGFVITGFCNEGKNKGLMVHVDKDGNLLCSNKDYTLDASNDSDKLFSIMLDSSNEIVLTGSAFTGAPSYNTTAYCFNPSAPCSGGIEVGVGSNIIPGAENWDDGSSVIETADGNYLIGGKWKGYPSLMKVDQNFNFVWSDMAKVFDDESNFSLGIEILLPTSPNQFMNIQPGHNIRRVIENNNGEFIATGWVDIFDGTFVQRRPFLLKTDASGNLLWGQTYNSEITAGLFQGKHGWGNDLIEIGDDIIMVGFSYENLPNSGDPNVIPDNDELRGFILQANKNSGNIEHFDPFTTNSFSRCNSITKTQSGDQFMVTGTVKDTPFTNGIFLNTYNHNNGSEFDAASNFTPQLFTDAGEDDSGNDIIKTSDGGYLIIGNRSNGQGLANGFRIIKADSEGKVN